MTSNNILKKFETIDQSDFEKRLRFAFLPPPRQTVSEWADKNRFLSKSTTAFAGRWQTDRVPYMRFIMDSVSNATTEQITLMMPSQVGKTELLLNIAGKYIDEDPCPILFIMPTKDLAESFSKERFEPMIRATPCLKNKIHIDKKSADNNIDYKTFPGGFIVFVGSQKANALASRPVRFVLADEIDRFAKDADGEGNPINLAKKRTGNFWNKLWVLSSTPTDENSSQINQEWLSSSMHRYYIPCSHCGEMQFLKWDSVRWHNNDPETAFYVCEKNGCILDDTDRFNAIDKGEWIAEKPEIKSNIGFHMPRFASGFCRLRDVVKEFLEANNNNLKLKVFYNTVLAETWKQSVEEIHADFLIERQEDYTDNPVPDGICLITAGVDVQKNRLEIMIVGWGVDYEAWVLDYVVIMGDPLNPETWEKLEGVLKKTYFTSFYDQHLSIKYLAVDSGYLPKEVLNFCYRKNKLQGVTIYATRGLSGSSTSAAPISQESQIRKGGLLRQNMKPFLIGTYEAKTRFFQCLKYQDHGGGYWHFPKKLEKEFFEQITSEHLIMSFVGGREVLKWDMKIQGSRNEALDTAILNLFAIHASRVDIKSYVQYLENLKQPKKIVPLIYKKIKT